MKIKKPIEFIPLPPECITFKGVEFWLDQRIQLTPLGKEIRYSGIRINEDYDRIWTYRDDISVEKSRWIYTFIYLDGSGLLEFEIDYNDNVKRYARKCDTE